MSRGASTDRVVIAGAGPQGLAACLHLLAADPSLRRRLTVVDPTGEWLSGWRRQFETLNIGRLRSPVVHHCDVEPMSLSAFTQHWRRADELSPPYGSPSSPLFWDFTRRLIDDAGLGAVVEQRHLDSIDIDGAQLRATFSDGEPIEARAVISTTNPARVCRPDWVQPCPQVRPTTELRSIDAQPGQRWVVVGAGLSAAHVAVTAADRGAQVTLVTRRPIRTCEFDTDPGWLGPKHLDAFEAQQDWATRYRMILDARDGGSMPQWMLDLVHERVASGRIELHEANPVVGMATPSESEGPVNLVLSDGNDRPADQVVLATGTVPDVNADMALAPHVTAENTLPAGIPILRHDLSWVHPQLFVMGRLAWLQLGPTAGNLSGARFGARRVVASLAGHRPRPSRRQHRVRDRLVPPSMDGVRP